MILPQAFLDKIEWYETRKVETTFGFKTVIVLHFCAWWRLPKKLEMEWTRFEVVGDVSRFRQTQDTIELLMQLRSHFKMQDKIELGDL